MPKPTLQAIPHTYAYVVHIHMNVHVIAFGLNMDIKKENTYFLGSIA